MSTDPPPYSLLVDLAVVLALFLLAGVVAGALWPQLVDPVLLTRSEDGITTSEVALAERFDHDGWYSLLAAGCGLVLGLVLTAWRRTDEVVTLLGVVAAAFLAAWVSAGVGTLIGPDAPDELLAGAEPGTTAPEQVQVHAEAAYLVWPVAAVTGALLVLWSAAGERPLAQPQRTSRDSASSQHRT